MKAEGSESGCNHLPDLLIPTDDQVECPTCGAVWVRQVEMAEPLHESGTPRIYRIDVCPECGAQEQDPPSDCAYCESGGQLVTITVERGSRVTRYIEEDER